MSDKRNMIDLLSGIDPKTVVFIGFMLLTIITYILVNSIIERVIPAFRNQLRPFSFKKTLGYCFTGCILTLSVLAIMHWFSPVHIPVYTLSNGEKTIVFQGMQHVGSVDYYNRVDENIRNARKNNFVIFREGIGAKGSPKYSLSQCEIPKSTNLLNLIEQPSCLGGIMGNDVYADISMDDLKNYYDKKAIEKGLSEAQAEIDSKKSFDSTLSFLQETTGSRSNELNYYAMKPYFVQKSLATRLSGGVMEIGSLGDFDEIIMDERNSVLTQMILDHKSNKIYAFYGAGHFKGVLKLLKASDRKWQIKSVNYIRSM